MSVRGLAWQTERFLVDFEGVVAERRDYTVFRQPGNPTYWGGNFLLFSQVPGADDRPRWERLFQDEIRAHQPATEHVAFAWDVPAGGRGALEPFLSAGYGFERNEVLVSKRALTTPRPNQEAHCRALASDSDWDQALENQLACREPSWEERAFVVFKKAQMERFRRMVEAGLGVWLGAFLDDRLAADLGLFARSGLGRFQQVATHPAHRRRGLCGTLVAYASQLAFERLDVQTLVIVADPEHAAASLYRRLGFRPTEHAFGLQRATPVSP